MDKINQAQEWIKQAEYDIETAKIMLKTSRFIYCVFMCHLSIEKAFKALYVKKYTKGAPKTHSLVFFAQTLKLELPQRYKDFIENLDEVSIPTRYPGQLDKLLKEYGKKRTQIIFKKSNEVLKWLKRELEKR